MIMIEIVKTIFMILGAYVFGVFIYATVRVSINRFNRWRKNGCKINVFANLIYMIFIGTFLILGS